MARKGQKVPSQRGKIARSSSEAAQEEEKLRHAVHAVVTSGLKTGSGRHILSISQAAKDHNVDKQKLRRRLSGISDRSKAHENQQNLSQAQETILKEWIKSLGHQSIPWTREIVCEKAELICGRHVGMGWVYRFMARHPDLTTRWTVSLESCRARALNQTTTDHFYKLLGDTIDKYNITPTNLYNMDEKGIQMGVGTRVRALVDRNQKTVNMLSDGNRELATMIECVCADGSALKVLAVFKAKRVNLQWARNNLIDTSIAASPNGWTDSKLGTLWLEKIFEPQTRTKLTNPNDSRLLILDGHNSHCTLKFLALCERFGIVVICLPPHMTHALQPCDVGVFGPLSTRYKKEVISLSKVNIPIKKDNLLQVYGRAHISSFKAETIRSAFQKCGIWPLNPNALPDKLFAPSLVTTTKPAQPLPASAPQFINATITAEGEDTPITINLSHPDMSLEINPCLDDTEALVSLDRMLTDVPMPASESISAPAQENSVGERESRTILLLDIPPALPPYANRVDLFFQLETCRNLLLQAQQQILADHAQKILMDEENSRLHVRLFQKNNGGNKSRAVTSSARLLTDNETKLWDRILTHKDRCEDLHVELLQTVELRTKRLEEQRKQDIQQEKERRETERAQEREAEKARKETQKAIERIHKEATKAQKQREKEEARAQKLAERLAAKAQKDMGREAARTQRELQRDKTRSQKAFEKANNLSSSIQCSGKENAHLEPDGTLTPVPTTPTTSQDPTTAPAHLIPTDIAVPRVRPRPRPAFRGVQNQS